MKMTRLSMVGVAIGMAAVLSVAEAANSPRGDCALKNSKAKQQGYAACNSKHGSTVTPDRTACIRKADGDWKTQQAECSKLSDVPAESEKERKK
jgi:hypothetical protein